MLEGVLPVSLVATELANVTMPFILSGNHAVANALKALKEETDWVTSKANGEGTVELIRYLIATDLELLRDRLKT